MKRFKEAFKILAPTLAIALTAVACGQQPVTQTWPQYGTSQASSMTPEQFAQWCGWNYGVMQTSGATPVCRYSVIPTSSSYYVSIPMSQLSPGNPYGGGYLGVSLPALKANDIVELGSQGAYGYGCNAFGCSGDTYTMRGVNQRTGVQATYAGIPAGITISDGTEVYYAGQGTAVTIKHDGTLRVGVNFYKGYAAGTSLDRTPMINSIRITRCVDAAGVTYSCS